MNRICIRDKLAVGFTDVRLLRDPARDIERCAGAVTDGIGGPGLGGVREAVWPSDGALLEDVLRLAQGMKFKALFQDLPFVGGKVGIQLRPGADPESAYMALGEFVAGFRGRLLTTEDLGTDPAKIAVMHRAAPSWVLGRPKTDGGSGDPSPFTAAGVLAGLRAVSRRALGRQGLLEDVSVFVKGIGHVGAELVLLLLREGARVVVADLDAARLAPFRDHPRVTVADDVDRPPAGVDIFCPCARGGELNADFALPVRAVAGAANNVLAFDEMADHLDRRGIIYVPDFVLNAGGLIAVSAEYLGYPADWTWRRTQGIGDRVDALLEEAQARQLPPLHVAYEICQRNFAASHPEADRPGQPATRSQG